MRYEEPGMEILTLDAENIVRTSLDDDYTGKDPVIKPNW